MKLSHWIIEPLTLSARYPHEYLRGIDLFNEGKFWESHEEWEKIWAKSAGADRQFYQALIQSAAALVHVQRQSEYRGLETVWNAALEKFASVPSPYRSLDVSRFVDEMKRFLAENYFATRRNVAPEQYPKIKLNDECGLRNAD